MNRQEREEEDREQMEWLRQWREKHCWIVRINGIPVRYFTKERQALMYAAWKRLWHSRWHVTVEHKQE